MANSKQPNILLIMPDQMRGDSMSLAGHPTVMTPNIDAIGAQGVYCCHAYSTCASCIPARRSLLTGQFPSGSGMVGFRGGYPIRVQTLPQLLADNGYHTAIAGRYMHQDPYDEPYGYQTRRLGSTYIDDDEYAQWLREQAPESDGVKGHGISFNGWAARPWQLPDHLHPTNWTVKTSREILREHDAEQPLFLTTSFYAPHPPLIPPAFYMERYLRLETPPAKIGDWAAPPPNDGLGLNVDSHYVELRGEALRSAQAGYYGLINHLDDQLSWLLAEFKGRSHAAGRPWIIVFTSDHGELLGDHYMFRKCEPFEGSSRVPFLIQGSADLDWVQGRSCGRPVCLEDIMPTLLAVAGVEIPDTVEGVNLAPMLRGDDDTVRPYLHAEHAPCYSIPQAYHFLTDERCKYIWRPQDGTEHLFDLAEDPDELHDLAPIPQHAELLQTWRDRLIDELKDRPEAFVTDGRLVAGRQYPAVMPHLAEAD